MRVFMSEKTTSITSPWVASTSGCVNHYNVQLKNYRYLTRMTKDSRKECKFFLQKNAKGSRLIAKVQNMRKFSGLLRLCRKLTTINDFVEIKFLTHQVHLQKTRKLTTICKVVRNVMENWNRSSCQNLLTNKNLK